MRARVLATVLLLSTWSLSLLCLRQYDIIEIQHWEIMQLSMLPSPPDAPAQSSPNSFTKNLCYLGPWCVDSITQ